MEDNKFRLPGLVFTGTGSILSIRELLKGKNARVVLYTDKGVRAAGLIDEALEIVKACAEQVTVVDDIETEPDWEAAQRAIECFRSVEGTDIVGIGGGSVLDMAKLVSITANTPYGVKDLLKDPSLGYKKVKTILIPTTAGTGAEATPNSIVAIPEEKIKVGIVNPEMIADAVILDGRMIQNLSPHIAAATAIDALAHAVECYTSKKANAYSDLFAAEAFRLIMKHGYAACGNSEALEDKNKMLLAAFYGGAAIAASGTTAVHALSYPLGGAYHIPHGVANAMLLLPVMRFNKDACEKELAQLFDQLIEKDTLLTETEKAEAVLGQMEALVKQLSLPRSLASFGVGVDDLDDLVKAGMQVERLLRNNKKQMTGEAARAIYLQILGGEANE